VSVVVTIPIAVMVPVMVVIPLVVMVPIVVVIPLVVMVPVMVVLTITVPLTVAALLVPIVFVAAAIEVRFIFSGSYEVHGPIAGVVLTAIPAPILRVSRRYMQVDGRGRAVLLLDQHRLRVNQRRCGVAELNLAIDAGRHLSRYDDVDAQIPRSCYAGAGEHAHRR
jgi:hypothetical protein